MKIKFDKILNLIREDDSNTEDILALELEFDDIVNVPVADASSVSDWNILFDLPVNGGVFTSVEVLGNKIKLIGGHDIKIKPGLFYDSGGILIKIMDYASCVVRIGSDAFSYSESLTEVYFPACLSMNDDGDQSDYGSFSYCEVLTKINFPVLKTIGATGNYSCFDGCVLLDEVNMPLLESIVDRSCFSGCVSLISISLPKLIEITAENIFESCTALTTIDFPLAKEISSYCFSGCTSLTDINLSSCLLLGESIAKNDVFDGLTGKTITITIPGELMTCNSGGPDGDIAYLVANNTVAIRKIYDSYISEVANDESPQLGGDLDTNGKNINLSEQTLIVLDNAMSEDEKWNGIAIAGVAGSALAKGDLIAFQASDSRWELCDANVITAAAGDSRGILGICLTTAGADGDAIQVLIWGIIRSASFPSFGILNAPVYISETAGDITLTAPTTEDVCVRVIGFSLSADDLLFNPSNDYYTYKP